MITRRHFLLAGAVSVPAGSLIHAANAEETGPFVCTTPQFTEYDQFLVAEIQLKPASGSGGEIQLNVRNASPDNSFDLQKFQLLLKEDAWQPADSLPGGASKIRVAVHFLDGVDSQKNAVQQYASEWLRPGGADKVEFVFGTADRRHIRVTFNTPLNQGALGRQALRTPDPQPTMYLGDVRPGVPERRVAAVIRHEFGHALGMRHEHQHPQGGIKWNRDAVIADYLKIPGWTAEKVQQFVFDIYTDTSYMCRGAPQFDTKSIMMYPIPRGYAQNIVVEYNYDIDSSDFQCVNSIYG